MAQSSSYKQYNRTTRVLTEESGFAGGMMWTGNNIDETHLKAIVNCDYDDTTGYLKARSPFIPTDSSPVSDDFNAFDKFDLSGYSLLGTYNICAFESNPDNDIFYDKLHNSGVLYIFAKVQSAKHPVTCDIIKTKENEPESVQCIYYVDGQYYKCNTSIAYDVTLQNVNASNLLVNYENQLYGVGTTDKSYDEDEDENKIEDDNDYKPWLHVYVLSHVRIPDGDPVDGEQYYKHTYTFTQRTESEVRNLIDSVNLLEAAETGFNAARGKNMATYYSQGVYANEGSYILGIYYKDVSGNVVASPTIGENTTVCVATTFIKSATDNGENTPRYMAMFQLKDDSDVTNTNLEEPWVLVGDGAKEAKGLNVFEFTFKFQKKNTSLYFTYYGNNKPDKPVAYSESAVDYETVTVVAGDNTANLKCKPYDFTTVNGTCVWKNRMCLWGVKNNANTLFFSEVDDFYYYPVPHNVALFTSDVVNCIPYKDTLLVFTTDKVYRISENNDGSFIQSIVQNDMPLSKTGASTLVSIKNMVLFKSKNYFYMIVPKSQSLTDELTIAPIYKNIAGFLNTLDKSIQEVLQLLYPEYLFNSCSVTPNPVAVYSEQDTVHILYDVTTNVSFKDEKPRMCYFKLFLNYNTNLRAWTLYVEDVTNVSMYTSLLTEDRKMSFVRVGSILKDGKYKSYFEIVTQRETNTLDSEHTFRLLLDTGYRKLASSMQKRFREVQLKIHSESESLTSFGTAFLVDGVWRRSYSKLEETLIGDNTISLMPVMDLNTFVTELSMPIQESGQIIKDPGSDAIELSSWCLDFSHFKREAPTTIRIPVSGKGYSPRFILMAPEATGLTINEINWVYRLMYGR